MVEQEGWAHLLVHYAIRKLMHQAACDQGLDPDRPSFTGCLRIVRRHLVSHAAFPLTRPPTPPAWPSPRSSPSGCRLGGYAPSPRVKRKLSNFKLKRPAHRSWPQPTRLLQAASS
jgi:hypothetical protein